MKYNQLIKNIITKKGKSKISMLTCYDFSLAKILDSTGLDAILVGDSLANVVLGLEETRQVSFEEMLNHTQAVAKAVRNNLVIADMPYVCYQQNPKSALAYAKKFIDVGAKAIKIEWFDKVIPVVKQLVNNSIPVMGHIGLTPQTVHLLGGYKVQGKNKNTALNLIHQAKQLEETGAFSLVLECIPEELAKIITQNIKIPTIGIGAGQFCDGQILVIYDLLGLSPRRQLKFVRQYRDLSQDIKQAVDSFIQDVKNKDFPNSIESFSMDQTEYTLLKANLKKKI